MDSKHEVDLSIPSGMPVKCVLLFQYVLSV